MSEEYFNGDSTQILELTHHADDDENTVEISSTPTRNTRHTIEPDVLSIWPKSKLVSCNVNHKSSMYFYPHCFVPWNMYFYNPLSALRAAVIYITSQVFEIQDIEDLKTRIANTNISLFAPFLTFYNLTCNLWSTGEVQSTDPNENTKFHCPFCIKKGPVL